MYITYDLELYYFQRTCCTGDLCNDVEFEASGVSRKTWTVPTFFILLFTHLTVYFWEMRPNIFISSVSPEQCFCYENIVYCNKCISLDISPITLSCVSKPFKACSYWPKAKIFVDVFVTYFISFWLFSLSFFCFRLVFVKTRGGGGTQTCTYFCTLRLLLLKALLKMGAKIV